MGPNTALAEPSVWQPMLQGGAVLVSWDPVTNSSILSFPVNKSASECGRNAPSIISASLCMSTDNYSFYWLIVFWR